MIATVLWDDDPMSRAVTLGVWHFCIYLFVDCLARIVMAVVDVQGQGSEPRAQQHPRPPGRTPPRPDHPPDAVREAIALAWEMQRC